MLRVFGWFCRDIFGRREASYVLRSFSILWDALIQNGCSRGCTDEAVKSRCGEKLAGRAADFVSSVSDGRQA